MNAADREVLNRRNKMSPEELHADIMNETFTPAFNAFFGVPMPKAPEPVIEPEGGAA